MNEGQPTLKPCAICGAEVRLIVDQTPQDEYEGSVAIIHPDGHPNCWNNNWYWGFGYKKGCRDEAIAEAIKQWNEHPDFDFFMGGSLSRRWRAGRERLRNVVRILEHYDHAREKHPYFCDELTRWEQHAALLLEYTCRQTLATRMEIGDFGADDVLQCELAELMNAVLNGHTADAIEEAYDCIAVLLRIIDVLEGRQPLGRPEEGVAE